MPATTYTYDMVEIESIDNSNRQREELGDIDSLQTSIRVRGLLHPIIVTRALKLVAGGRRLEACHRLQWPTIPVHWLEDLPTEELKVIELEENLKRKNLEWKEECKAIRELHETKTLQYSGWTMEDTGELVGIGAEWVSKRITVANALDEGDEHIASAQGANAAYNIVQRKQSRALDDALDDFDATEEATAGEPRTSEDLGTFEVFHESFLEWSNISQETKFNLIHCDFPYGLNHQRSDQGGSAGWNNYDDREDIYWELLEAFTQRQDNFIAKSAHLIFWFSMKFYEKTIDSLAIAGWKVDAFPLIWHKSDNSGILPDPERGPRRIYETALYATRGDRRIVRSVSNAISYPQGEKRHLSEKPFEVVHQFLRMLTDDNSRVLDPTCGCGNALAAAKTLGAKTVIGFDSDPDSASLASRNLRRAVAPGSTTDADPLGDEHSMPDVPPEGADT